MEKTKLTNRDSKRLSRWLSVRRQKDALKLHHLPKHLQPTVGEKKGFAVSFEKVTGWSIIDNFPALITQTSHQKARLQLCFSLFHLASGNFFGNSWYSNRILLHDQQKGKEIDLEFYEMTYLISSISDESCVGVVELIACEDFSENESPTNQIG
jgi:hypothetical protein